MSVINTHSFGRFWPVSWTITLFLGPSVISMIYEPRGAFTCRSMTLTILSNFWFVSCTITRRFGVPERFPRLTIPEMRLRVRQQRSRFLTILAGFMDYYSLFCGHEEISIVVEPQGELTCRSSTFTVFGRFWPASWSISHCFGVPK